MDLDQWHRCKEIFTAARELPPGDRQVYLDEACGSDGELRDKVQRLLDAEHEADGLLTAARAAIENKPAKRTGMRLKDRYVIESELAEGGLGIVYLAHDELLHGRPVVVKFPSTGFLGPHRRASWFAAEIEALARINDPGVVGLLDTGYSEDGQPFLVMQYVAGQTLRDCLTGEPIPPDRAVQLIRQMARALDAAHSEGVCHLDLKPENVMLLNAGRREERAVIIDFGIARFMQGGVAGARIKTYAGSPSYMAPEQLAGKGSASSDIYSLGVVALEMLTGVKPEAGESIEVRLGRLPAGPLRRARTALARAIHGDLQHRFATARSFSDALDRALPPPARRTFRERWLGAAVALYVIGSLGYIWHVSNSGPAQLPEPMLFTSLPGEERHPTLDPAGREVYFSYRRFAGGPEDIYSRPAAGGELRRITDHPSNESQPAVSADGEWIAFLRSVDARAGRPEGPPQAGGLPHVDGPRSQVILQPRNGGGERVAAEGAIDSFAWHPSGEWLVTAERRSDSRRYQLLARSLRNGAPKTLTEGAPFSSGDRHPVFTADGRRLAYVCASPSVEGDVCVLDVGGGLDAGGDPVRVTSLSYPASRPAWTADDRELVFVSGPAGREVLWRVPAGGGAAPIRIPLSATGVDAPFISRAARLLVFSRHSSDSNIWRLRLSAPDQAAGEPEPLLVSTVGDLEPAISPDNRWIAYVTARTGNPEVWVSARDGSRERRLTRLEASATGGPVWSPDSSRILFHSNGGGNLELYVVSLDGGVQRLTRSEARETTGAWSSDGRWIYFTSDQGGRDEIWRMSAGGGAEICVTGDNGSAPRLSADGRMIYYTVRSGGEYSLWRVAVDGGVPERVAGELSHRSLAVTADGAYFFARQPGGRGHELRHFRFGDRSFQSVRRLDRVPELGLTVAPDGSEILYAQVDSSGSDLYLVRPFE
jgi:Tol biopolymer transport system component